MRPYFIILYGPTAVGKTALVEELSRSAPIEVINGDVGQLYSALSIGTAKPDLKVQQVNHHLFDVVHDPVDYSVFAYRQACSKLIAEITHRGKIPVIVGGSGFYMRSLFYRVYGATADSQRINTFDYANDRWTWDDLGLLDPERAKEIHPNDSYRINRAFEVFKQTGCLPSSLKPVFEPVGDCKVLYLDRDREDLSKRINQRVVDMFAQGWVAEVESLSPEWRPFLKVKGLMGYGDISAALDDGALNEERLIQDIQAKTRSYARRQRIFWRSLKRCFLENGVSFEELNLTFLSLALYIKQLSKDLSGNEEEHGK